MSAFGEEGDGDTGDDWEIVCNDMSNLGRTHKKGDVMYGSTKFFLIHADTDKFLMSDNDNAYT